MYADAVCLVLVDRPTAQHPSTQGSMEINRAGFGVRPRGGTRMSRGVSGIYLFILIETLYRENVSFRDTLEILNGKYHVILHLKI